VTDITSVLRYYRIAARGIWNTFFWPDPMLRNWDTYDQFQQIKRLLFHSLVLVKIDKHWPLEKLFNEPIPYIRVVPMSTSPVPIMISNPKGDRNWYWDDPVSHISRDEAGLRFLDFFDWDLMDYLDFQYFRVRIDSFPDHPSVIGRDALLDVHHVGVFLTDEAAGAQEETAPPPG
jgi:hypothetical protein